MPGADALAEDLHAAAGAGRLDHRGLHAAGLGELLRGRLGVREHGRRADDADLVAGLGLRGHRDHAERGDRGDRGHLTEIRRHWVLQCLAWEVQVSHGSTGGPPWPAENYRSAPKDLRRLRSEEHTSELQSLRRIAYA